MNQHKNNNRHNWIDSKRRVVFSLLTMFAVLGILPGLAGDTSNDDPIERRRDTRLTHEGTLLIPADGRSATDPDPGPGIDAPVPRSVNFPLTLPSAEHNFSQDFSSITARDQAALAVGQADGLGSKSFIVIGRDINR